MDKFSSSFLSKLIRTVRGSELLTWGERVLTAVSGGVDSTVLLCSLYELRHYFGINIACASFDHKIRPSSGEDITFVKDLCKKLSVPFYTESKDVKSHAKENKLNLEESARILRYGFLMESASDFKAGKIAVAHHLDDFAENFVMRLITGGGTGAIAGFPIKSGIVIRPFINHSKYEILNFAEKNRIVFKEDYTNWDTAILRNFVRRDIIPLLKMRNSSFLNTVRNTSGIFKKDDEFIGNIAIKVFKDIAKFHDGEKKIVFGKEDLSKIEDALLYRLLKISVSYAEGGGVPDSNCNNNGFYLKKTIIYYKHFKAFLKLIKTSKANTYFQINSYIEARKEYDDIIIENISWRRDLTFKSFDFKLKYKYDVIGPGDFRNLKIKQNAFGYYHSISKYEFAEAGESYALRIEELGKTFYIEKLGIPDAEKIKNEIAEKKFNFPNSAAAVYFDFDKIDFPVIIRQFKEGDRFAPLGVAAGKKGGKKLKEYFIDKKVPINIRKVVPVILFGSRIAWVSFNVISDYIKITGFTNNVGAMRIE